MTSPTSYVLSFSKKIPSVQHYDFMTALHIAYSPTYPTFQDLRISQVKFPANIKLITTGCSF